LVLVAAPAVVRQRARVDELADDVARGDVIARARVARRLRQPPRLKGSQIQREDPVGASEVERAPVVRQRRMAEVGIGDVSHCFGGRALRAGNAPQRAAAVGTVLSGAGVGHQHGVGPIGIDAQVLRRAVQRRQREHAPVGADADAQPFARGQPVDLARGLLAGVGRRARRSRRRGEERHREQGRAGDRFRHRPTILYGHSSRNLRGRR